MRGLLFVLLLVVCKLAGAAPGYSVWGEFKYAPGFTHFDDVNPRAPKGGELRHDVLVMKGGAIVESGPVHEVLDAPRQDYTRTLVAAAA